MIFFHHKINTLKLTTNHAVFFTSTSWYFSFSVITVVEDGDSKDDVEARALLNKFLGATALMTGIESNSGLSKEFLSTGSASSKNQRVSILEANQ